MNLRWYLANSVLRRTSGKNGGQRGPDRVPLAARRLAPPGGARHDGLRPGREVPERRRTASPASPTTRGGRCGRRRRVSFSRKEKIEAEGISRDLAEHIVASFRAADLPLHAFEPIRRNVIRGGGEWVPAILRYNRIPARVLVEVCNLNNPEDRRLLQTRRLPREGGRGRSSTRSSASTEASRASRHREVLGKPRPLAASQSRYTSPDFSRRCSMRLRVDRSSPPSSPSASLPSPGRPGLARRQGPRRRHRQERQGRADRRLQGDDALGQEHPRRARPDDGRQGPLGDLRSGGRAVGRGLRGRRVPDQEDQRQPPGGRPQSQRRGRSWSPAPKAAAPAPAAQPQILVGGKKISKETAAAIEAGQRRP